MIVFFVNFKKSSFVREKRTTFYLRRISPPRRWSERWLWSGLIYWRSAGSGDSSGSEKKKMRILYDRGKCYRTRYIRFFPNERRIFPSTKNNDRHRRWSIVKIIIKNSEIIVLIKLSVNGRTLFFMYRENTRVEWWGRRKGRWRPLSDRSILIALFFYHRQYWKKNFFVGRYDLASKFLPS